MLVRRTMALGLLASVLAAAPARAADIDKLLPTDADMVMYFNIRQAIDSPLVKKHFLKQFEDQLKDSKEAQDLLKALDLDPMKDVTSVTVAGSMSGRGENMLVVVRGKFNMDRILGTARTYAREQGKIKVTQIGGKTVVEGGEGRQTFYGTFLDNNTIVATSSKDMLTAAIEGKTGAPKNKELANVIGTVDGKQTMWMAVVVPEDIRKRLAAQEGPQAAIGGKMRTIVGGVTMTKDVAVAIRVEMTDADAAKELGDFIDQAKGLLKFLGQSDARFEPLTKELVQTLQVRQADTGVNLSFKLSEPTVEKLIKNFDLPAIP